MTRFTRIRLQFHEVTIEYHEISTGEGVPAVIASTCPVGHFRGRGDSLTNKPRFRSFIAKSRAAAGLAAAVAMAATSAAARAGTDYWDPTETRSGTGSGGNGVWDLTDPYWYTGTADVDWPNTSTSVADFAATAGTVTLGSAITAGGLVFDTAGYTLNTGLNSLSLGTSGIVVTPASGTTTTINGLITSLGSQTWTTASGCVLTLNATYASAVSNNYNLTLSGVGTFNFAGGLSGSPDIVTGVFTAGGGSTVNVTGFLNTASNSVGSTKFTINGGSTVNWSGSGTQSGIYAGIADSSSGTLNVTAGAFNASPSGDTFIGNGAAGLLNITGGVVTVGTNTAVYLGDGYAGSGSSGTGTILISNGQFTTGTTTGFFVLGSSAGTGIINLNGGTFSTNRAFSGTAGKASINFNGGTLQATGTSLTIPTAITATIEDNGATVDTQTFAVTLAANLNHGGTAATDGGLTKIGSGALTLTGTDTFNGATVISAGSIVTGNALALGSSTLNYNNQGG